jgi:hypothetical protein
MSAMLLRTVIVWFVLLVIAIANGAVREALLIPATGEAAGRAISTVMLSLAILILTWATIRWIRPRTPGDAWRIGGVWVALTLAFEFLAGHYLFGTPWSALREDYDVLHGRIWVLVLVTTAVAPTIAARARGAGRAPLPR